MINAILAFALAAIPVPHSRFLARCSAVPVSTAGGITVVSSYQRPGARVWALKSGDRFGVLACYKLGDYSGAPVYACHGPTVLRDRMAEAPECTHVVPWSQIAAMAAAQRDWIADRSVCCGESSRGRVWRCSDTTVTVTRLDGYGPGVVAGTDPCEAYQ